MIEHNPRDLLGYITTDKHGGILLSYAAREGDGVVQLLQARKAIKTIDPRARGEEMWVHRRVTCS